MLDKKEEICEGCIQSFKKINEKTTEKKMARETRGAMNY